MGRDIAMVWALLSVADKTGLVDLGQALLSSGYQLLASGGTARALTQAGLAVTEVADYTHSPEILEGRVKTLHPKIHGGILGRPDYPQDAIDMAHAEIIPIAVVVVNLYPFQQTIARPDVTEAEAIEQIDIGGVALLRAAAKNFEYVSVLCDPQQYPAFIQALQMQQLDRPLRRTLAQMAFEYTSGYDRGIAEWFSNEHNLDKETLPTTFSLHLEQHQPLRYGENPHQQATWYRTSQTGFTTAKIVQGKALSFNNLMDLEAARRMVIHFAHVPCAVIVKHANPCGVALGSTISEAYIRAYEADSTSAFGGIVGLSQPVDAATATELAKTFLECIFAPSFTPEALAILQRKTQLRLLELPDLNTPPALDFKAISGGLLVQQVDGTTTTDKLTTDWQTVTQRQASPEAWDDLIFAWRVVQQVKSNAIVVAKHGQTLGIGAGQMNRVGSVHLALTQAGAKAQGAVLASDGFFPFEDSVRLAHPYGIQYIVQPGGSKRDAESIAACDELGLVMVFTGIRHFLH